MPVHCSIERVKQRTQWNNAARHQFNATLVTGQAGKFGLQKTPRIRVIEALELAKTQLVEQHCQRHQFRQTKGGRSPPFLVPSCQQVFFPFRLERLAKFIDQTKHFRQLVHERPLLHIA
jgi:hypothetical protein